MVYQQKKDKGPAFSGTVLIWEASWLWHIIFRFPPIQNGRSRPTVWPDKPLKLDHLIWNQMPSDVLHDACICHEHISNKLPDKLSDKMSEVELLNECVLLILNKVGITRMFSILSTLSRLENGTAFSMCGKTNRFHFFCVEKSSKTWENAKIKPF